MSDTATAVAESQSAPVVETIALPKSGTSEYAEWRVNGEIPKPKTESAPTVEPGEATTPRQQETPTRPKPKTAEQRIAELESTIEKIRKGANLEGKKPEPQPASDPKPVQATRPKPTVDGKGSDGKPYATYEDFTEDLADWKAEQREVAGEQRRAVQAQQDALKAEVEKARGRYDNLDEVMFPTLKAITEAKVAPVISQMLNDSEVLPDLLYTIGSDSDELAAFVKMAQTSPGKAIRYLAVTENLIREELDKASRPTHEKGEDGKFVKEEPVAPAKRGPESAPEPPIEIASRGAGGGDAAATALSAIERGNPSAVRAWMQAENAKDLRRRRGV
jgi:hypothetical protein